LEFTGGVGIYMHWQWDKHKIVGLAVNEVLFGQLFYHVAYWH